MKTAAITGAVLLTLLGSLSVLPLRGTIELALIAIGGFGGLVAHELGHAFAYRRLCPTGSWHLECRGPALSVVVDPVPRGLRRSAVSLAGPAAGIAFVLAISYFSSASDVFVLFAFVHGTMLLPMLADGRHLIGGLREQWAPTPQETM